MLGKQNSKSIKNDKIWWFRIFFKIVNFILEQILMFLFSFKILISLGKESHYIQRKKKHQNLLQNKIRELEKNSKSSNFVIFGWFYFADIVLNCFLVCIQPGTMKGSARWWGWLGVTFCMCISPASGLNVGKTKIYCKTDFVCFYNKTHHFIEGRMEVLSDAQLSTMFYRENKNKSVWWYFFCFVNIT